MIYAAQYLMLRRNNRRYLAATSLEFPDPTPTPVGDPGSLITETGAFIVTEAGDHIDLTQS